jgi:hypothetical protein
VFRIRKIMRVYPRLENTYATERNTSFMELANFFGVNTTLFSRDVSRRNNVDADIVTAPMTSVL